MIYQDYSDVTDGNFEPKTFRGVDVQVDNEDDFLAILGEDAKSHLDFSTKKYGDTADVVFLRGGFMYLEDSWSIVLPDRWLVLSSTSEAERTLSILSNFEDAIYEGVVFVDGSPHWVWKKTLEKFPIRNPYNYTLISEKNLERKRILDEAERKGVRIKDLKSYITVDTEFYDFNIVFSTEMFRELVKRGQDKVLSILVASSPEERRHFEGYTITAESIEEALDYIFNVDKDSLVNKNYMFSGAQGMRNMPLHLHFRLSTLVGNYSRSVSATDERPNYNVKNVDYIRQEFFENSAKWDTRLFSIPSTLKNMVDSETIKSISDKSNLYSSVGSKYTPESKPFINAIKTDGKVLVIRPIGSGTHGGRGVRVVVDDKELNDVRAEYKKNKWVGVVTDYIKNPLLFDGKKCHLRCYLIVTSWGKAFAWDRAEIITAELPYIQDDYTNEKIHDTHGKSTDGVYYFPNNWLAHTSDTEEDVNKMSVAMNDALMKLYEAVKYTVAPYKENKYGYKLMGVDLMFTDTFQPQIIEVNVQPDLGEVNDSSQQYSKLFQSELLEWEYKNAIYPVLSGTLQKEVSSRNRKIIVASTRVETKIIYIQWEKVLENNPDAQEFINVLRDSYKVIVLASNPYSVTVSCDKVLPVTTRFIVSFQETFFICNSVKRAKRAYNIFEDDVTVIISKNSRDKKKTLSESSAITCYSLTETLKYILEPKKWDENVSYMFSGNNGLKNFTIHSLLKGASLVNNKQRRAKASDPVISYPPAPYVDYIRQVLLHDFTWDRSVYDVKCFLKNNVDIELIKGITDKSKLYDTMKKLKVDLSFIPVTKDVTEVKEGEIWIVRPVGPSACSGKGISVVTTTEELEKGKNLITDQNWIPIVTEYINNPLLFKGRKFHLRCYILISSWGVVSLHKEAKIFTGAQDYQQGDYCNKMIHDTHADTTAHNYIYPEDFDGDTEKIKEGLDLILLRISQAVKNKVKPYKGESEYGYTILGLDVMFTDDYTVKLIEVNSQPGMWSVIYPPNIEYEDFENKLLTWEYEIAIEHILNKLKK